MLQYINYSVVFREVPNEVTLAINLSNCPHRCKGCHSPYLRENIGETLDIDALDGLLDKYGDAITCVCFMGGDASPEEVEQCAAYVRGRSKGRLKTGWYSGNDTFPEDCSLQNFDFVKLGAYVEHLGGLDAQTTNQRFYRIVDGEMKMVSSSEFKVFTI